MTAEATGVKKITVNFNKAVDTTTSKIVVKKGSATPTITATTFAADAKSAEIVMGTKLTAGTYTVEATVGEDILTADIAVQDEKLTSFALVSNNLVATPASKSAATISYKALNQYGEMMPADNVTATCSFGKVAPGATTPTADRAGKITVTDIPDVLAVPGATGTLVLVEGTTGVNLNETITYQTKAVASVATVYGIYDSKTEKLIEGNLTTGTKLTNYSLLVNVQDQYGSDMTPANIIDSDCKVSYNPASVLTNASLSETEVKGNETELSYDGKSCFLIKMATSVDGVKNSDGTISGAGTLSLTVVSANKGVIASPSFTIDDKVIIQSLSISAKDTVYANEDNELVVEAIDKNGNAVTKYDVLKSAIADKLDGETGAVVTLKKNADGTGTFYYKPVSITGTKDGKWKNSEIKTLIFKANDATSGNLIVKTINVTVYANKEGWKVSGTTADTTTATAVGKDLVFKLKTLSYEDQYSNTLKATASQVNATAVTAYLVDKDKVFGGDVTDGSISVASASAIDDANITLTGTKKGTATLYLKYKNSEDSSTAASPDKYDIKVSLAVVDTTGVTADQLKVTVNNGNAIYGVAKAKLQKAEANSTASIVTNDALSFNVDVVVTGVVNGKTVVIPKDSWTIVGGAELGGYGKVQAVTNPAKTEEKTVTVIVDSTEGPQEVTAKVTVSSEGAAPKEIKAADVTKISVTSGTAIDAAKLYNTIKVVDQYGTQMTDKASATLYTITFTGKNADTYQPLVKKNATMDANVTLTTGEYTATVKYVLNGITFEQSVTFSVS